MSTATCSFKQQGVPLWSLDLMPKIMGLAHDHYSCKFSHLSPCLYCKDLLPPRLQQLPICTSTRLPPKKSVATVNISSSTSNSFTSKTRDNETDSYLPAAADIGCLNFNLTASAQQLANTSSLFCAIVTPHRHDVITYCHIVPQVGTKQLVLIRCLCHEAQCIVLLESGPSLGRRTRRDGDGRRKVLCSGLTLGRSS